MSDTPLSDEPKRTWLKSTDFSKLPVEDRRRLMEHVEVVLPKTAAKKRRKWAAIITDEMRKAFSRP